ncbi:NAD(P)-binding protein [Aaosphaeria arxii CBS 175.79]|uniref:NAD(P)-binding protein n=1 Tax=Aaosphaeria arxii CBS 175.79 TaxID=1450172 RepID=A0A6A5Y4B3_9PLEO|nr:NAD(P)-binding protein [Aaosphaeria arxii CBS 175.79]KAF2019867.1 NAD(P)-binding protein [Aaosphaeria arxii CBS 175.79]
MATLNAPSMERRPSTIAATRYIITGGSGFLGNKIVEKLLIDPSANVTILSRNPKQTRDRVSYFAADISSDAEVRSIFNEIKPHAVIHTASPLHNDTADAHYQTNVEGTNVLLKAALSTPETVAFVYTSSESAVKPSQEPLTEDKAELYVDADWHHPYGKTKAMAEGLVLKANGDHLKTAVIRLPGLYGEGDTVFVPHLMESIHKNEHKTQVGNNTKMFEFVYVDKAAEAHILATQALLDPVRGEGVAGEAFFISDGKPQPFFDFARKCYAAAGSPVEADEVSVVPLVVAQAMASTGEWAYKVLTFGSRTPHTRRDDVDHLDQGTCWSIEKAKQRLGYEPVADQDEAIRKTMEWAKIKFPGN